MTITQEQADAAIAAARRAAEAIGVPMNIAVLDGAAHLKAFARMDGAPLGAIDIAIRKARTAALFGVNTETLGEYAKPGGPAPGIEHTNGGLVVFPGGIPVRGPDGLVVAAVGVSGGAVTDDFAVATAAVAALRANAVSAIEPATAATDRTVAAAGLTAEAAPVRSAAAAKPQA